MQFQARIQARIKNPKIEIQNIKDGASTFFFFAIYFSFLSSCLKIEQNYCGPMYTPGELISIKQGPALNIRCNATVSTFRDIIAGGNCGVKISDGIFFWYHRSVNKYKV